MSPSSIRGRGALRLLAAVLPALGSGWLVGLLCGCGAAQTPVPPPGLPPLEAAWAHLLPQVPDNARGLLLVSFDGQPAEVLSSVFDAIDLLTPVSQSIRDALGPEDDATSEGDAWGLRPDGALAIFLQGERWVAVVDLDDPDRLRQHLDRLAPRNPDWAVAWRELDGQDVLTVAEPLGIQEVARTHILLSAHQAVVVHDRSPAPDPDAVDELLLNTRNAGWTQNVMYNRRFGQAVGEFGGSSWVLFYAETPGVLQALPPRRAGLGWSPHSGRPPAPRGRCEDVERSIGEALPLVLGAAERGSGGAGAAAAAFEGTGAPAGPWERWSLDIAVDPLHQRTATALLPPAPIDWAALSDDAMAAAFVSVDPRVLADAMGPFADAAGCPSLASEAGLLGGLGQAAVHQLEFGPELGGLVGGALFDVRNTGGVPFADAFLALGATRTDALAEAIRSLLEQQLHLVGTAEHMAGFNVVRYRFALLYLLGIFDGADLVGVTIGRVEDSYLQAVLQPPAQPDTSFLRVALNGPRLANAYHVLADLGVLPGSGDAVDASERASLDTLVDLLERTPRLEVAASYADGVISVGLLRHGR